MDYLNPPALAQASALTQYAPIYAAAIAVDSFTAGGSDDTVQINNALAYLQAGSNRAIGFTPGKQYTISASLTLTSASNFLIEGNNAVIKAASGMASGNGTQMLYMTFCTSGVIKNLNLDGNRSQRTPQETTCHSIDIFNNCSSLKFFNCTSINAVCDGWYLGCDVPTVAANIPTDIWLVNCVGTNAYRNNLSVVNSLRFRDFSGVYNGANGTLPMAGIDVEPNSPSNLGNVDTQFFNTTTNGNTGLGVQVTQPNSFAKFFNLISSGNGQGAIGGSYGTLEIYGITMENYTTSVARGLIDCSASAGETHIQNVFARNCLTATDNKPLIYVHSSVTGPTTIDAVRVINCSCAVLGGYAPVIMNDVVVDGPNTQFVFLLDTSAAASVVKNVVARNVVQGWYLNVADVHIENVILQNPTGAALIGYNDTGSTALTLNNFEIYQSVAVPGGQTALYFHNPPAVLTNVVGKCDGTAWTAAQLINFATGTLGSFIANVSPFTNPKVGTAVLSAGTVTVTTPLVAAASKILLTTQSPGGTVGAPYVNTITAGTSFVIKSSSTTDTSTVYWQIV